MLASILAALGGLGRVLGFATSVASQIANYKIMQLKAGTEEEKIRIQSQIDMLQMQTTVMQKWESFVRFAAFLPFLAIEWVYIVWDKIVMGGTTSHDNLSPQLWYLGYIMFGFYFVHWTVGTVSRFYQGKD